MLTGGSARRGNRGSVSIVTCSIKLNKVMRHGCHIAISGMKASETRCFDRSQLAHLEYRVWEIQITFFSSMSHISEKTAPRKLLHGLKTDDEEKEGNYHCVQPSYAVIAFERTCKFSHSSFVSVQLISCSFTTFSRFSLNTTLGLTNWKTYRLIQLQIRNE